MPVFWYKSVKESLRLKLCSHFQDIVLLFEMLHWRMYMYQKLHTDPLAIPECRNWSYFRSTSSSFRDAGPFYKLPYLGMKHGIWKKCARSCIFLLLFLSEVALATPWGRNWAYCRFMDSSFRDTEIFSKLPYLGMKPEIWKKCQMLHIDPLSTPMWSKLILFSFYGQRFPYLG